MYGLSKAAGAWFLIATLLLGTVFLPDRVRAGEGGPAETRDYADSSQVASLYSAYSAYSAGPGPVEMIIDGIVVRPLSLVATVIGTVAFVVTVPFSALGGNVGEAADTLVVTPASYTFTRCLGCWRPQYEEATEG